MRRSFCFTLVGGAVVAVVAGSLTIAQQPPEEPQLPPGWTMDDVTAMARAGTPGEMHQHLAKRVGQWDAKTTMWMVPDSEPIHSQGSSTGTSMFGGRYFKIEITGDMPGMGTFNGYGLYGYDNVAEQFQSVWIDDHSTGMAIGTGELSEDGSTLTWNFEYHCPITEKPTRLREIERTVDENTTILEMHGIDPKSGKEFKMMEIELTRKGV